MVIGHLPSEVRMRTCDIVAKCSFTSTHLMLPYFPEAQLTHTLICTVGVTVGGGNFKHFKISVGHARLQGIGHFSTVSKVCIQTSDSQCSLSSKMNVGQTISLHLKRRDNCEKM